MRNDNNEFGMQIAECGMKKNNSEFQIPNSTIGKLYGVGIGPGDPKLLTLKAKEILEKVETIFVPKSHEDKSSCARSIIESVIPNKKNIVELVFPMTKDKGILKDYWRKAAEKIAKILKTEKTAAFVTIGDPFVYSTYIYLLKTIRQYFPNINTETIPGITSFNAAASCAEIPLVEADEKLAVLPVTKNLKGISGALKEFDTVVLMKVGSKLDKVINLLKKLKLIKNAVLVSHAGCPDEKIIKDLSSLKDKKACGEHPSTSLRTTLSEQSESNGRSRTIGYLSVVIVKPFRRSASV